MDGWDSETLSDAGQMAFFRAARARQKASERDRQERNTLGFCVGMAGLVGGLTVLLITLNIVAKLPQPQPPQYVLVDKASGAIVAATSAKDAPASFPEATRRAEIRILIVACESYIPQTWAKADFHQCMIRLTPEEQKRRNLDIGVEGPRYPAKAFGPSGWAMPTDFPLGGIVLLDTQGNPPNEIYHYAVRYERTEVASGIEQRVRWSADVRFGFRPDLQINAADALANPGRMQVSSFSTIKDRGP